jgi:V/A-type H+/Na+-transporting ATPase subunit K
VDNAKKTLKLQITGSLIIVCSVMAIVFSTFCTDSIAQAQAAGSTETAGQKETDTNPNLMYALISAAAAFGLGAIGAGYAISHVGAAAMGDIAEKPQIAGQALIFVALAEGIVVFGFITALMILNKT